MSEKPKILLVEDEFSIQQYLNVILKQYGYEIIIVDNGQEAWEVIQQDAEINLVLSDWIMPIMEGPELCKTVRAHKIGRYIYIILMTSQGPSVMVEGMEAGADDFLTKPVDPSELRVRLDAGRRILDLQNSLAKQNQALQSAYSQISDDLESAAKMQQEILPQPGAIGDIRFEWLFYPANYVAGDTFNVFELDEEYVGFYQLDVAGHGVRSALLSFTLYHRISNNPLQANQLLRKNADGVMIPAPPEEVLRELNNEFQASADSMLYFTIIYGYIHKPSGRVMLSQGGHPSPIFLSRETGESIQYGEGGFPVGMLPDMKYESLDLQLEKGDRLFLYSDGVTECMNAENELFSEERLCDLLAQHQQKNLGDVLQEIGKSLRSWSGCEEVFDDDTTILAIERI